MVLENPNLLDFERELFTKPGRVRVGVQWKSDICLDIECECGNLSHLCDGMFGHWVCEVCGRAFKLPTIAYEIEPTGLEPIAPRDEYSND